MESRHPVGQRDLVRSGSRSPRRECDGLVAASPENPPLLRFLLLGSTNGSNQRRARSIRAIIDDLLTESTKFSTPNAHCLQIFLTSCRLSKSQMTACVRLALTIAAAKLTRPSHPPRIYVRKNPLVCAVYRNMVPFYVQGSASLSRRGIIPLQRLRPARGDGRTR